MNSNGTLEGVLNIMETIVKCVLLVLILSFWSATTEAANTGKVAGKVVDAETGDPLIGANVIIVETNLGAATDEQGRFNILQVPPGEYSVRVTYIGYQQLTVKQVEVRTDLTARLTLELSPTTLESEAVEVVAEKRMVQHDVTSTRRSVSSEEIQATPGIENVSDIFRSQAGMIIDDTPEQLDIGEGVQLQVRDPSLTGINIRGSAGGDALILIDGIPASHPIYGGFDVMDLNKEDIQNIEIITGSFSAEYGQTQSAVINITTRSGGEKFRGSLNYRTDELGFLTESYGKQRVALNFNGPEPLTSNLLPNIGLDLPGSAKFFATVTLDMENTQNNNHRTRGPLFELPVKQEGGNSEWFVLLDERQVNEGNINLKVDYKHTDKLKSVFSYRSSWRQWTRFDWNWKDLPDHMAEYSRNSAIINYRINHTLSNKSFYRFNVGYTKVDYLNSYNMKTPNDFWVITEDTMFSTIDTPERDPLTGFYESGYEAPWVNNFNEVYTADLDVVSQLHPEHQVKTGFTVTYKELDNLNIAGGGISLSEYGRYIYGLEEQEEVPPPAGPYKKFGQRRWVVTGYPKSGSFYLTDKFERESLIINAGLRGDWFMPGPPTTKDAWKEQWERATGLQADWPLVHYQVDPRLGISFPISTITTIYFSYGHFNKLPGLDNFIRDPYSGGFTGNPHLDFEKTVKYEFGFTHEFTPNWAVDIKNYTKETSGQVGTTQLRAEYGIPIQLHDNKGYSRARGLEFELRKNTSNYYGGRLTYTLQWANGYSSSAFDDYRRSLNNFPNPIRERRLNWDVRHQIVMQGNLIVRPGQHPNLFGIKLPDDWKISVLSRFSSGRPYTPGTHDPSLQQQLHNSRTGPPSSRTDVRIEKGIQLWGYHMNIGLDIDNIFNEYNVNISRGFNVWTGEPYTFGDKIQDTNEYYTYYEMYRMLTPNRFGLGRHMELIFEFSW